MYNLQDLSSLSAQIIKLIRNEVYNNVSTAFLAEVIEVKTNSAGVAVVDIKMLNTGTFNGEPTKPQVIKNVAVGIAGVKKWLINLPIQTGDIGLCVACKWDISNYMQSGRGGEPATTRTFDVGDAIFLPLSIYLQPAITEDLTLTEATDKNIKITLKSNGNLEMNIKGNADINVEGNTTLTSKQVDIKSGKVNIGESTLEKAMKGETFMQIFNKHNHVGNLGAPTGTPIIPMTDADLSTEVKNS